MYGNGIKKGKVNKLLTFPRHSVYVAEYEKEIKKLIEELPTPKEIEDNLT